MKKITTNLILLCFCIFGVNLFSQNEGIAETYPQIIDISYTPISPTNSEKYSASLFSDAGSWIGFTNPDANNWVNGFCGPYTIDDRSWISKSIAEVSVEKNGREVKSEQFKKYSVSYSPGLLYMSSKSENIKIEQQLTFIDKNHTILQLNSDAVKWNIHSTIWLTNTSVKQNKNSLVVQLVNSELLVVTFPKSFNLTVNDKSYSAKSKKTSDSEYILISFYNNQKEYDLNVNKAKTILKNPAIGIRKTKERWDDYLSKALRNDMPPVYNKIAVKSVVTLISNWRAAKGDLLHDGVIPSHANIRFNGFWAWDSWKHAVALAHFSPQLAKEQVRAMFDYQAENGVVPDCVFPNKNRNNFRNTKAPLASWAVMEIYNETKDIEFLKELFPKLVKYNRWWYDNRDHDKNGICEYGSANGLTKNGRFESGMDNAVRFDSINIVQNGPNAWSLNQESVDLNAFLFLENKILKQMATIVNSTFDDPFDAKKIDDYFYDTKNEFYYDRKLNGDFIRVEGTEAFIPLWTKLATKDRAEAAIKMVQKPNKFSTYIPFPTVSADHPEFGYDKYWRGPVWIDQVYFGIAGIRNYGYTEMADNYTDQIFTRLEGLSDSEPINENYDPHTGKRLKASNFSWSAAHLLMMYWEYGKTNSNVINSKWEKAIAAFELADLKNPPQKGGIEFIGSSTIRKWTTLEKDFPGFPVYSRGFGGSQISDSKNFAARIIIPYAPKKIFFHAGDNDLAAGKTPNQVFIDFKDLVATIHEKLPKTEVFYISLKPSEKRWRLHLDEIEVNQRIKEFSDTHPLVTYIDSYDLVSDSEGKPRPELFLKDKLHLNEDGYNLLIEKVRPFLKN